MTHKALAPRPRRTVDGTLIEQARVGYASGVGVEHAVVREWLQTWGTPDRRPFKEWLDAWGG